MGFMPPSPQAAHSYVTDLDRGINAIHVLTCLAKRDVDTDVASTTASVSFCCQTRLVCFEGERENVMNDRHAS